MGFFSDLFGGGQGDPGPSELYRRSGAKAQEQSDRLLDAFFGSNRRKAFGSNYGSQGIGANESTKAGWGDTYAKYNYAPQTSGSTSGSSAIGAPARGGNSELWGGNTPFGNMPILQQMLQASTQGINENNRNLAEYLKGTEGAYREAQKYGTGQAAVIDADSAKALQDINALTIARMNASGLGGSTLTNDALGANAAGNIREKMRAKADLADRATGMKVQQRNIANQGRASLGTATNATNQALRMSPIEAQLRVLMSNVANPFSPTGGSAPQDTSAITGLGSVLGNIAGAALGTGNLFGGGGGSSIVADGGFSQRYGSGGGYYGLPAGPFGF